MENINIINELIHTNPLALLTIKSEDTLAYINDILPFSTGFEIECDYGDDYNEKAFTSIPYIMDVNNGSYEQRYRIPKGLAGLVCLYLISDQLKRNSKLNPGSGIHYHVDTVDCFHKINQEFLVEHEEWILNELDTWGYRGSYNKRSVHNGASWLRTNSGHKTLEFRCGEMTFEYPELVKNILHANQIIKRLKNALYGYDFVAEQQTKHPYLVVDTNLIRAFSSMYSGDKSEIRLKRLRDEQKSLEEELQRLHTKPVKPVVDVKAIIRNRTQKIN